MIRAGTVLYGYCDGHFGRSVGSYGELRVEAVGPDWVVARDQMGRVQIAESSPEELEKFTIKPAEEE